MATATAKHVTFEPIADRLVIRPDLAEQESPGGIVLPEGAVERPQEGVVIAVGPGMWSAISAERRPMQIEMGDRVLFSPYAERVTLDDVEYVLVKESDVLSILR